MNGKDIAFLDIYYTRIYTRWWQNKRKEYYYTVLYTMDMNIYNIIEVGRTFSLVLKTCRTFRNFGQLTLSQIYLGRKILKERRQRDTII